MSRRVEQSNRLMLRARHTMDRSYAEPLDVPALARIAHASEAHFIRTFRATFGETPHRYLQRRRVERAMFLLTQTDQPVTEDCRKAYEKLKANGVEVTDEPTERFYGIDCGLRDPFGNNIRMTEPNPDMQPPTSEQLKAEFR